MHRAHRKLWLAAVVLDNQRHLAAVDSPGGIGLCQRQFDGIAQHRHPCGGGAAEVDMRADGDGIGTDPGGARRAQAAAEGQCRGAGGKHLVTVHGH